MLSGPASQRIDFLPVPPAGTALLVTLGPPWNCCAVLAPIGSSADAATAVGLQPVPGPMHSILCQVLPTSDSAAPREPLPGVALAFGPARIWISGPDLALSAPAELHAPLLSVVAEFLFFENELRKLEWEIEQDWDRVAADLPLANDVNSEDLKRSAEIGSMTRTVGLRRIRTARLEQPLLATRLRELPPLAQKIAKALRRKFAVEARLETLDGQLEVYEYNYEMANQRIGEYRNFRKEFLLEILIVLLLASEVILMVVDLVLHYHDSQ